MADYEKDPCEIRIPISIDAAQLLQEARSPETPGLFKTFPPRDVGGYALVLSTQEELSAYLDTPQEKRLDREKVLVNFSDTARMEVRERAQATVEALIKKYGLPEGSTAEDLGEFLKDRWAKEDGDQLPRGWLSRYQFGRDVSNLLYNVRATLGLNRKRTRR